MLRININRKSKINHKNTNVHKATIIIIQKLEVKIVSMARTAGLVTEGQWEYFSIFSKTNAVHTANIEDMAHWFKYSHCCTPFCCQMYVT